MNNPANTLLNAVANPMTELVLRTTFGTRIFSFASNVSTSKVKPVPKYAGTTCHRVPSNLACIINFQPVEARMRAPFRGTFQGVVRDAQPMELTQSGSPKRSFKLVDPAGCYIICCALHDNAENAMIKDNERIVVYFGTGRGPIGSSPGMLYLMKDSVVLSIGHVQSCDCRCEIIISN